MLIPLGTNRPLARRSRVVPLIIGINLVVFVIQVLLNSSDPQLAARLVNLGSVWRNDLTIWTPITSAFLHGDFWHIAGNMLAPRAL